jgi:transposase
VVEGKSRRYRNFSPEFREEAVKTVLASSRPIAQVAREIGINEGTVSNWLGRITPSTPMRHHR